MIIYNPLWKLLIDKGLSKADFRNMCNISKQTLTEMNKNNAISFKTINRICNTLHCGISDVIEHIPDNE